MPTPAQAKADTAADVPPESPAPMASPLGGILSNNHNNDNNSNNDTNSSISNNNNNNDNNTHNDDDDDDDNDNKTIIMLIIVIVIVIVQQTCGGSAPCHAFEVCADDVCAGCMSGMNVRCMCGDVCATFCTLGRILTTDRRRVDSPAS